MVAGKGGWKCLGQIVTQVKRIEFVHEHVAESDGWLLRWCKKNIKTNHSISELLVVCCPFEKEYRDLNVILHHNASYCIEILYVAFIAIHLSITLHTSLGNLHKNMHDVSAQRYAVRCYVPCTCEGDGKIEDM